MAYTTTKRMQIRQYLKEMLQAEVDVGDRVFTGRPNSPLFLEELPAVNIHFADERADINVGNAHFVKEYLKTAEAVITVVVENQVEPDEDPMVTNRGEDYADYLGGQVERAFHDDWMFARRLDGFDADYSYQGLTHGSKLTGTFPYDIETEGGKACIGQVLRYSIPYSDDGTPDRRYPYFEEAVVYVYPGFLPVTYNVVDSLDNNIVDSIGNDVVVVRV